MCFISGNNVVALLIVAVLEREASCYPNRLQGVTVILKEA